MSVGEAVVGYGGAMVLLGLREETADIDIDVNPFTVDWIKKNNPNLTTTEGLMGPCLEFPSGISIHPVVTEHLAHIDGVVCYSPNYLLKCYKAFRDDPRRKESKREQDAESIRKLEVFITTTDNLKGRV